jgi:hypothetical protein
LGLAHDLLQQANHLATYEGANPSQASLRRAVSTAYYALFHLLVEDAGGRWQGSVEARTGLERALQHGSMEKISRRFRNATWEDWLGNQQPVPLALQRVARAFVDLQDERHTADYDNHEQWSPTEVQRTLGIAHSAFQNWQLIRTDPMAGKREEPS